MQKLHVDSCTTPEFNPMAAISPNRARLCLIFSSEIGQRFTVKYEKLIVCPARC